MPPGSPLSFQLSSRLATHPLARAAVARAVADEDGPALARLLRALDLDGAAESVERLLDGPGPFLPCTCGWT